VRPSSSSSYLAVVAALTLWAPACGDNAGGGGTADGSPADGPTIDAPTIDGPTLDAAIDGPTLDAPTLDAAVDANPVDAPVDGVVPLAVALDPTFGQGGDVRFPATSGMGALSVAHDGDILACGPSLDLEDFGPGAPVWFGRIDADGAGAAQVWTIMPPDSTEGCTGVVELADGRYAVLTHGRLMILDAAGTPVTTRPLDILHRLYRIIAAPDGGVWAFGVDGLWRFDSNLVPVPTFGVGGLVAVEDGRNFVAHGATMATARLTFAFLPREVRRIDGATGALDPTFGGTGTISVPQPPGSTSAGLTSVVARAGGAVGVHIDVSGPDGGRGYGMVPISAVGVPGPPVYSGLPDFGRATVDANDRVFWPSSVGGPFIEATFPLSRTNPGITSVDTSTIAPPPGTPNCVYRPVGAVTTTGSVVIGYTSRCFEPGFGPRFVARLVRLAP